MRILTIAAITAGLLLGAAQPTTAQKKAKSGWCDQAACVKACTSRGGVIAGCPRYCEDRIRKDSRCK